MVPADAEVGANVIVCAGTRLGSGVVLGDGAVVGKPPRLGPRSTAPRTKLSPAVLEDGSAALTGAVVFAGAILRRGAIAGDQSHVRERAEIGSQSTIGRGSAVDNDVRIGARVRIQTNCYLTAYSEIEDDVFVGPGVITTNDNSMARHPPDLPLVGVRLRRACRIGGGAVICPGVEVGEEAFVAAGAVVIESVPARAVMAGVPARHVRDVPDEDLIERWQ